GVDVRQLPGDHSRRAVEQATDQRDLKDAETRVEHLADGLRPRRRIERLRHARMIRAMAGNHTIGELLAAAAARLAASGSDAAHLEAELLLAQVLGKNRSRLKSHPEETLDASSAASFGALIERRADGEPLAYLVGYRDFWTLRVA